MALWCPAQMAFATAIATVLLIVATSATASATATNVASGKAAAASHIGGGLKPLSAKNNPERSFMMWMLGNGPDSTPAKWAARIANIKAHAENVTGVMPCIYDIGAAGTFAHGTGPRPYAELYPHMKELQAMGLQVVPLIAGPPNLAGQRALTSDNGARFIKAAVAEAVENKWAGYNFDNELRGKMTDESWRLLNGYGAPWMCVACELLSLLSVPIQRDAFATTLTLC